MDDRKIDFVKPSEDELLKLAGGSMDMVNTGKNGMELRTILAQRVSINFDIKYLLSPIFIIPCISTRLWSLRRSYMNKQSKRD